MNSIYTHKKHKSLFVRLLLFLTVFVCLPSVYAQQTTAPKDTVVLEGFIENSTTLNASKVYVVKHNVKIGRGATLTIEKNTTVLFTHTSTFVVEGGINIVGEPNAFVTLTSLDEEYRGVGIVVRGGDGGDINIRYAKFIKLSLPIKFDMEWYRKTVNIQHCLFKEINTGESAVVISMPLGAFVASTDKVTNFNFTNNNFINNWGSVFIENFQDNILNLNFSDNILTNNVTYGIDKGIPSNSPVFGLFDNNTKKYQAKISNNSIFGNYQINASTDTIIREISFGIQGRGEKFAIPNNFFRSTDAAYISSTFDHFFQNNELPLLISEPFLRAPSATAHAHIYKVNIQGSDVLNYSAMPKVNNQNVPFQVFFNRPVTPVGTAQLQYFYFDTTNQTLKVDTIMLGSPTISADKKQYNFVVADASFMKNELGYIVISNFKDEEGFLVPEFPIGKMNAINTYNKLFNRGLQSKYFNPAQMFMNNQMDGSGKLLPENIDIDKLESLTELGDLSYLGAYTSLAKTWEIGIFGGTSNYFGETASSLFAVDQFRWSGGIWGQYNISKWFSARLALNYIRIAGSDIFDNDLGRRQRYANFRNDIMEGALTLHFHLLQYGISKGERFSPSVYAGIAVFKHNPMARIVMGLDSLTGAPVYLKDQDSGKDLWFLLQQVGTEGQTVSGGIDPEFPSRTAPKQYSLWQIAIPVGINLDFIINKKWTVGADIGFRMTFTDYLDDISGYYFDRKNNFQAIVDANPTLKAKTGLFETVDAPVTFRDYSGTTRNTAAVLAAPSIIGGRSDRDNDAFNFPNAKRGIINRDWYMPIGLKASKILGYNKYEKKEQKRMEDDGYESSKSSKSKKSSSSKSSSKNKPMPASK